MMDLYLIFRASAKACEIRMNKADAMISNVTANTESERGCRKIRNESSEREIKSFNQQTRQLVKDIAALRDFLLKNRKQYVNIDHWLDGSFLMSDYERDLIDSKSEALLKSYKCVLRNLSKTASLSQLPEEHRRHQQAIIEILTEFVTAVSKLYGEQKAIRCQKSMENRKLLRIENLVAYTSKTIELRLGEKSALPHHPSESCNENVGIESEGIEKAKVDVRRRKIPSNRSISISDTSLELNRLQDKSDDKSQRIIRQTMHQKVDKQKLLALEADVQQNKEEWARVCEELRPEERIQLEAENKSLIEEYTAKNDELKKLTGQVVEIANLQSIFAEKVVEQDMDIFRIHDVTIHSTENIKMGNEAIRQAMKKKAFMRVFIIFTLIVLSFTLLFLDWYNQ